MKGRGDDASDDGPSDATGDKASDALGPGAASRSGADAVLTLDDAPGERPNPHGIRVVVSSMFLPEHSNVAERRWAFSYTVTIANEGAEVATLLARHWVISDGSGNVEHVRGPGVVGQQPRLEPGQTFVYTSGAVLRTSHGVMQGEYLMERPDGARFDAPIPPFALAPPDAVH